nr:hypothetical protein [Tanacetum cinerariifolium]
MYGGGCFNVGGSFKGFDWINEPVGFDDRSLLGKSKDEFSNEVILDDVVPSPATTLSLLLKSKGKSKVKFTRMREIIKRYARSRRNGKMIVDSIENGSYLRRMIATPGEPDLLVPVPESFHEQTNEELTETDIKQMDADDQAI